MKKLLTMIALAAVAGSASAALIGFEAESGTLGSSFDPAIADAAASGGQYITSEVNDTGAPGASHNMVTYSVTFAEADTYDLYGRIYIGAAGSLDDSFHYGSDFATTSWVKVNGIDITQPNGVAIEEYVWVNLSDFTGTFGTPGVTFTVAGAGVETFQIAGRENGLRFDGFAFGTSTETFSDAQLTAAIPEPATLGLVAAFGGTILFIRRTFMI